MAAPEGEDDEGEGLPQVAAGSGVPVASPAFCDRSEDRDGAKETVRRRADLLADGGRASRPRSSRDDEKGRSDGDLHRGACEDGQRAGRSVKPPPTAEESGQNAKGESGGDKETAGGPRRRRRNEGPGASAIPADEHGAPGPRASPGEQGQKQPPGRRPAVRRACPAPGARDSEAAEDDREPPVTARSGVKKAGNGGSSSRRSQGTIPTASRGSTPRRRRERGPRGWTRLLRANPGETPMKCG